MSDIRYRCGTKCIMGGICEFERTDIEYINQNRWRECGNSLEDIFINMKSVRDNKFVNKTTSEW